VSGALNDPTRVTVEEYEQYVDATVYGAERQTAEEQLAGKRVLDLGCGTGRLLPMLSGMSEVVGADLAKAALTEARKREHIDSVSLVCSDARALPFASGAFGGVLCAYNGLDFAATLDDRAQMLRELERVIDGGGSLVFSSHNPVGELLNPRGLRSLSVWRYRLRYLVTGQMFRRFFRDQSNRRLYHAAPRHVIREVERSTTLRFRVLMDRTGRWRWRLFVLLFAPFPYYVFEKISSV
jgi:ubiquinone/menaquinone biosynthesis C-methylase UbiE